MARPGRRTDAETVRSSCYSWDSAEELAAAVPALS